MDGTDLQAAQLRALLAQRSPITSAELQVLTGRSQPTLSRALARLTSEGVVKLGRGRRTRYALAESILRLLPGSQPLYRHDEAGRIQPWGQLTWLGNGRIHVDGAGQEWLEQGRWPWFLSPLRLEGFLGRLWARRTHLARVVGTELQHWTLEQQLYAALTHLHDGPGAYTLGSPAGEPAVTVDAARRGEAYDHLASDTDHLPLAGSSAAGEQSKFLVDLESGEPAQRRWTSVIVKFSAAPRGTPFGDRWHDLLHAEALALQSLAAAGHPAAVARVIETPTRTYLECERFDRMNRHGRRHAVALSAVHHAFVGGPEQHWAASCHALASRGLLSRDDADRVALWRCFGSLIGNNDMHFGNLSLWADDPARPRFALAPSYDMLPMRYRPGDAAETLGPSPLAIERPPGIDTATWEGPHALAEAYWDRLSTHAPCTPPSARWPPEMPNRCVNCADAARPSRRQCRAAVAARGSAPM